MDALITWIQKQSNKLSKLPIISADLTKLNEQIKEFKETFKETMEKESQIVIIRYKKSF